MWKRSMFVFANIFNLFPGSSLTEGMNAAENFFDNVILSLNDLKCHTLVTCFIYKFCLIIVVMADYQTNWYSH